MKATQRSFVIRKLITSGLDEETRRVLMQGFIPPDVLQSDKYKEFVKLGQEHTKDEPCDVLNYSNYFAQNPSKLLFSEKEGSGYINPVLTVGKRDQVISFFDTYLSGVKLDTVKQETQPKMEQTAKNTKKRNSKAAKNEPGVDTEVSVATEPIKEPIIDLPAVVKEEKTEPRGILTVQESIRKFNSHLTKEQIQAWVWYKRQHGNPMRGWEEYYIDSTSGNLSDVLVYAKKSTVIKTPAFEDLRELGEGTLIGRKTKFKNEYRGVEWIIVRSENGDLFYVNSTETEEKKINIKTDSNKLDELVNARALCFYMGEYVPVAVFINGDIYETLAEVEKDKENILAKFDEETFEWQKSLLKPNEANKLRVDDPVKSKRFKIGCLSEFSNDVEQFYVKELDDETGIKLERPRKRGQYEVDDRFTLFDAFNTWLDGIKDSEIKNTTKHEIRNYYFAKRAMFKDTELSKAEQEELKNFARVEAENLYGEFLATALTYEDRIRLNEILNRKHNNFNSVDGRLIPIGLECSTHFGVKPFKPLIHQRDAVGFLSLRNSGCLAYQVGFGKTISAIINMSGLLCQGKIKRPIVAVPKPVYANWKKELFGYYRKGDKISFQPFEGADFYAGVLSGTRFKLNDWYNLSDEFIESRGGLKNFKNIPEGTITLVTYQGLARMGFSDSIFDKQFDKLNAALGGIQATSERDYIKQATKREADLMTALKDTVLNYDELALDYTVVDEAHNFKNLFPSVGKDPKTGRALYGITSGESMRAKRLFFLTIYLQEKYNGNVCLMTATPFTNSPLEIFSMFNYIGYNQLVKANLQNINRFFDLFVLETIEYKVDKKGDITTDRVIKSFNNKIILNKLLYSCFDYKDDPREVNIVRPCKWNFPNDRVDTYLDISPMQIEAQNQAKAIMASAEFGDGNIFRALAMSLNNALSPFLALKQAPSDYTELLEESPKIKYAVECIRTIKEYHENRKEDVSGTIIYMSRGVDLMPYIKEALEYECGYKKRVKFGEDLIDEVEIIEGGGGEASEDRKEIIKEAFNAGVVKVILGTSTIKEGVNLQVRGATLFILVPDWNPTDINQVEGRIHRQGNTFGFVRIVTPLVQNTIDAFIFQKYDEKRSRINNLWDRGNESNISENSQLDPEEIKFALVNDANELLKLKIGSEIKKSKRELQVSKENLDTYSKLKQLVEAYKEQKKSLSDALQDIDKNIDEIYMPRLLQLQKDSKKAKGQRKFLNDASTINNYVEKTRELQQMIKDYFNDEDNNRHFIEVFRKIDASSWDLSVKYADINDSDTDFTSPFRWPYDEVFKFSDWELKSFKNTWSQLAKAERSVLAPYGLTYTDDLSEIKARLQTKHDKDVSYLEHVQSPEFAEKMRIEVVRELESRQARRGDMSDQVAKFAATNYILSYKSVNMKQENLDTCFIPEGECCSTNGFEAKKDYAMEMEIEEITGTPAGDYDPKEYVKLSSEALKFVPKHQVRLIRTNEELNEVRYNVNKIVSEMPGTYEQEGTPAPDQIVHLHYFHGNMDWYITEKDKGDKKDTRQIQAFGYASFGQEFEMGYINIEDLVNSGKVELDLYFKPRPWKEVMGSEGGPTAQGEEMDVNSPEMQTQIREAIDTINEVMSDLGEADKAEANEALIILKEMLISKPKKAKKKPLPKKPAVAKAAKVSQTVYIDYLNKDKRFQEDRKYFKDFESAKKWAQENFEKWDLDMIKYEDVIDVPHTE